MAELLGAGAVLGMGNPLLDISATVEPALLAKHGLKANDAILTEEETIFDDIKENKVEYIAGGATQNSIRVAQWVLGGKARPELCSYMGCVGRDDSAEILEAKARECGVKVCYQHSDKPTGRCAVLITGTERSLVTKLDAANLFTLEHLEVAEHWALVKAARIVYSAGFFLTVSTESMLKVGRQCAASNSLYCINLSAPFLCQFFKDQLASVLPFADIVFGNETEAAEFAKQNDLGSCEVAEVALRIAQLPKENGSRSRLVVITQGSEPVIAVEHGVVRTFPVQTIPREEIVDTNGAGDAFVGGFLAQQALGRDLETRVRCGNWAAQHCIKRSGCTMPDTADFEA